MGRLSEKFCAKCQHKMAIEDQTCGNCGHIVGSPQKGGPVMWFLTKSALFLIFGGAGIFLYVLDWFNVRENHKYHLGSVLLCPLSLAIAIIIVVNPGGLLKNDDKAGVVNVALGAILYVLQITFLIPIIYGTDAWHLLR